ncbi:MAG TPA: HD domain-containing protein [Desulfovibrio sp.]|uniref:HD domain-containing protein n=1 Tax=Desulfovibrio sp. TaxID=885 RepID=UPI002D41FB13|nr:HD domain-containing protein [Desulfovibrio sp.]HZF60845.1 HD domain-containing protein [Desulfovibrio sp.]
MNCTVTASADISMHLAWFTAYAAAKTAQTQGDALPMDIKLHHSLEVLENARHTVEGEGFEQQTARACLLAALYHDVARFEQYLRYHTFRDRESCNHGQMGVRVLKAESRLVNESPQTSKLVMAAVGMHNRFALPKGTPEDIALVTNVVRDADKLDILRIMDEHLSGPAPYNPTVVLQQPDDPTIASEAVLKAVREKRVAAYMDLRCVNDFRLLLATWFFDLHFASSRRKFLADGHAQNLLRSVPDTVPQAEARDCLLHILETAL